MVALYREKGAYLALPFFVVFALTSLTESIAVQYNDMRWVIFVALAVKLALSPALAGRIDVDLRMSLRAATSSAQAGGAPAADAARAGAPEA